MGEGELLHSKLCDMAEHKAPNTGQVRLVAIY